MLGYYRNALNFVFFNESVIICALFSVGVETAWKEGISLEELFSRSCFLANLLKREEVLKDKITTENREYFDTLIKFMQSQRIIMEFDTTAADFDPKNIKVKPMKSGEALQLLIGSICWPMVDSYYVTLVFALSMVKRNNVQDSSFTKDVQWIAESLFVKGELQHYEACNQPSITNAKGAFIEAKIFVKKGAYVQLHPDYRGKGEPKLLQAIEGMARFRQRPADVSQALELAGEEGKDIRRMVL